MSWRLLPLAHIRVGDLPPRSDSLSERRGQAEPERLEGELLRDVDPQAAPRVEHPLDRLPRPGRVEAPSRPPPARRAGRRSGRRRPRPRRPPPGPGYQAQQIASPRSRAWVRARRSVRFTCSVASRVSFPLRPALRHRLGLLHQAPLLLCAGLLAGLARRVEQPAPGLGRRLPPSGRPGRRPRRSPAARSRVSPSSSRASSTSPPLRRAAAAASSPGPERLEHRVGRQRPELDRARSGRGSSRRAARARSRSGSGGRTGAGSSSVLSSAFWLSSRRSSASSITKTRRPPSAGLRLEARITDSRTSSTRCWAPGGRSQARSGCGEGSSSARRRASSGIGRAVGEQLRREGPGGGRLAGAPRPAEDVGVAGRGERRRQRRAGPRLVPGRVRQRLGDRRAARCSLHHAMTAWTSARTAAWTESRSPSASTTRTRSGCRRATSS